MKTEGVEREELHRLYWTEGLTLAEIGARLGITRQGVAQLMKVRGIPRRSRSGEELGDASFRRWRAAFERRAASPVEPTGELTPLTLYAGGDSITVMLPPRGPVGDPVNYERAQLVREGWRRLRIARRAARARA
jgi:hypothetical protein